jgi:hypothetical protein
VQHDDCGVGRCGRAAVQRCCRGSPMMYCTPVALLSVVSALKTDDGHGLTRRSALYAPMRISCRGEAGGVHTECVWAGERASYGRGGGVCQRPTLAGG